MAGRRMFLPLFFLLGTAASCTSPAHAGAIDMNSEFLFYGSSVGTAAAGTVTTPTGKLHTTTAAELLQDQAHAASYDGPTDFVGIYRIVIAEDGTLDSELSTISFKTLWYTSNSPKPGTQHQSSFQTNPVTITSYTLDLAGDVDYFTFAGPNWYSDPRIISKDLTGSVDLLHRFGEYTASYQDPNDGAIYTYRVIGQVPEPSSAAVLFGALAAIGLIGFYKNQIIILSTSSRLTRIIHRGAVRRRDGGGRDADFRGVRDAMRRV